MQEKKLKDEINIDKNTVKQRTMQNETKCEECNLNKNSKKQLNHKRYKSTRSIKYVGVNIARKITHIQII